MTERGKALQKENIALKKHEASLKQGLTNVNSVLTSLHSKDAELHKKIFETPLPVVPALNSKNEGLILAAESGFKSEAAALRKQIAKTASISAAHNAHFNTLEVDREGLAFLVSVPSIQPIENPELTKLVSGFGDRINPFHKGIYHHPGADFAASRGTAVFATAKGIVVDITNGSSLQAGYGNLVEIDHGNGLITRYAHLDLADVRIGQHVTKGTIIGTVGMTGGAIAPHVHFEIIRNGKQVDPIPYLLQNLNSTEYSTLQKLGSKKNQTLD
jgi:murein DD-endopeptidase MepM/ murein hydrolase activator NlpD